MILTTLTGTLFIFQGQEIGMINVPKSWGAEEYLDIKSVNYLKAIRDKTCGKERKVVLASEVYARTPMHWDDPHEAGFTSGKPWMRTMDLYKEINVAAQEEDSSSVLSFWKKMLKVRVEHMDLFVYDDFKMFEFENPDLFGYGKRAKSGSAALVVLNFTKEEKEWKQPTEFKRSLIPIVSSYSARNDGQHGVDKLRAYEGRVFLEAPY
jgi:oligo-1,6-glucosidase